MFKKFGSFFKVDNNNINNYNRKKYIDDNTQMVNSAPKNESEDKKDDTVQNYVNENNQQTIRIKYNKKPTSQPKKHGKVNYSDYAMPKDRQTNYHDFISRHRRLSSEIDKKTNKK